MAFIAEYSGVCNACEGPIKPGEEIQDSAGFRLYEHVKCPGDPEDAGKPCSSCFLIHKGECF